MRLGLSIAAVIVGWAAVQEIPTINAGGIVPNKPGAAGPLTPGIEVSNYGHYLGPLTGCTARANDVKQLCGTAVTVGGIPAALLYVQQQQINLRIPANEGTVREQAEICLGWIGADTPR